MGSSAKYQKGLTMACKFCELKLPRVKGADGVYRHPSEKHGLNFRCANPESK